jgi:hypothetical protein
MSDCDHIIQSELKNNIKRLLKGTGYLYEILVPTIKEWDFLDEIIDDNRYNEELFMIEYDILNLLNSNDNNLKAMWINKYLKRQYKLEFDDFINHIIDKYIDDDFDDEDL